MGDRAVPIGTLAIGAVLALAFAGTRASAPSAPGPQAPPAKPEAAPASAPGCPASTRDGMDGTQLLAAFLADTATAPERVRETARRRGYAISTLIATLPDPTDSRLDWGFDFDLEALLQGHQRLGLVLDRFWLPWSRAAAAGSCPVDPTLRARRPGVVLFRAPGRLHLLYLVGEIPTAGLHKAAFAQALHESRRLGIGDAAAGDTVRIVGPLYSGSSESMALVLRAWVDSVGGATRVSVLSGSATGMANLRVFEHPRIRFAATVMPDPTLARVLTDEVVRRLGLEPRQVALLSEGTTAYGQGLARTTSDAARSARDSARAARAGYLRLTYPLSISGLRAEYQRNPDPTLAPTLPGSIQPRIPLDIGDPAALTESPPVMSRLTPAAVDLLLDAIARTLRDRGIRAVGVLGTDIRDKLFLAQELRRRLHDVQLFTFGSNVLLSRPEYRSSLRGMLVLSTYPLLSENQRWTASGPESDRRGLFPTDAAQGVYNATLIQLGRPAAASEYAAPFDSAGGPSIPPVWVTLVGRGRSIPLATFTPTRAAERYVQPVTRAAGAPNPEVGAVSGFVVLWTIIVGIAVIALGVHLVRYRGRVIVPFATVGGSTRPVVPGLEGVQRIHGELYLVILLFALAGVFAPTAALLVEAMLEHVPMMRGSVAFLVGGLLVVAIGTRVAPMGAVLRKYRDDFVAYRTGPAEARWTRRVDIVAQVVLIALAIGYMVLVLRFTYDISTLDGPRFVFFVRRALAVDSGLSPMVPILLIGLVVTAWALWHRARVMALQQMTEFEAAALRRADEALARLAEPGPAHEPLSGLARAGSRVRRIRESLFVLVPDPWAAALFVVVLALGVVLWMQFDRTVESIALLDGHARLPSSFDLLLRFGVLASIGLTIWTLYRFVVVWRAFRAFLAAVRNLPIVSAFDRLPQRVSEVTRASLVARVRDAGIDGMLQLQASHLHRIYESGAQAECQADPERGAVIARAMERLPDPSRPGPGSGTVGRRGRQFEALYEALEVCWAKEPTAPEVQRLAQHFGDPKLPDEAMKTSTTGRFRRMVEGAFGLWVRAAEELVASEVVEYIEWTLRHLRRLASLLLAILVLVTILLSSYPFQPHSSVKVIFFGLVLATTVTLVAALVQMNRDEVLSRTTRTVPGTVSWDTPFVMNVALFGIVPLLAVLSAEFPAVRTFLFAWVEPLFRALARG